MAQIVIAGYDGDDERRLGVRDERAEFEEFYSAPRSVEPSSETDEIDFATGRVEPSHEIDNVESTSDPSVEIDENRLTLARVDTQGISGRVQPWLIDCPDRVPLVLSDPDCSGLQSDALALLTVALGITIHLVTVIWLLAILFEAHRAKHDPLAKIYRRTSSP